MRACPRWPFPTVILWAERRDARALEAGRELAALLPDARFELVADAAHEVGSDQPGRYAELVA